MTVIAADLRLKGVEIEKVRNQLLRWLPEMGLNVVEDEADKTSFSIFAIEKRVPLWQTSLFSLMMPSLARDRVGLRIRAFGEESFTSIKIEAKLYIPELDMENPKGSDRGVLRAAGIVNFLVKELEALIHDNK